VRTTITLDDALWRSLRERARRSGRSFKEVVNEAIAVGLRELERPRQRRYRLRHAHLGRPRAGVDLDRALAVADALADEATAHELERGR